LKKNKFTDNAKCIPHTDVVGDKEFLKTTPLTSYERQKLSIKNPIMVLILFIRVMTMYSQNRNKECCNIRKIIPYFGRMTLIMGESAVCGLLGLKEEDKR
jgi:hypothetical protein